MVFSLLVILFIGIIAFFHYVQGFFSATISAMITVIAAALALGYDETVVNLLLKGKMADQAHGMVLCMIFAVVYIVLRIIFDAAIPGNVRTPSTVDKVGAGLMGVVAGIFCTGIFAIGVQMLPFDPTISFMDYSRYKSIGKRAQIVPLKGPGKDSFVYEEMNGNSFQDVNKQTLWIPSDDLVLDTIYHLSDGGSLAGSKSLASVHPDYLQELYGERLGIQVGAKRVTLNLNGDEGVDIAGLFTAAKLPCFDGQLKEMRPSDYQPLFHLKAPAGADPKGPPIPEQGEVAVGADQRILIVRVKVKNIDADDADQIFRFSTGSIHLVGRGNDGKFKDFYPIGELAQGKAVILDKPDDFLFTKEDGGFDAVFIVDASLFGGDQNQIKIKPDTSISVKRFADLDLSGMDVSQTITFDPSIMVYRSALLTERLAAELAKLPAAPTVSSATAGSPGRK